MLYLSQEFTNTLSIEADGEDVSTNPTLSTFIRECIRACLLINASDPPVVLGCPGWSRLSAAYGSRPNKPNSTDAMLDAALTEEPSFDNKETDSASPLEANTIDKIPDPINQNIDPVYAIGGDATRQTAHPKKMKLDVATPIDETDPPGKVDFDRRMFREYTLCGDYLNYVVWPVLFLHKDGPVLHKGVAEPIA